MCHFSPLVSQLHWRIFFGLVDDHCVSGDSAPVGARTEQQFAMLHPPAPSKSGFIGTRERSLVCPNRSRVRKMVVSAADALFGKSLATVYVLLSPIITIV